MKQDSGIGDDELKIEAFSCPHCGAPLKSRYITNCPNCGVELAIHDGADFVMEEDVLESGVFDPENVWLFTDIVAKANFRFEKRLEELEQDIRFSVMRGKPWRREDIEYMIEIRRLLDVGLVRRTTSFWFSSPFQTIFRAMKDGLMTIAGTGYTFRRGDDIVWQCQMSREVHGLDGPVFIGRLTPRKMTMLCKKMEGAMKAAGRIIKMEV
ncbi:MAG: zinc ribbon domain-containing protein [Candidatus Thorarchaeota archaeon]